MMFRRIYARLSIEELEQQADCRAHRLKRLVELRAYHMVPVEARALLKVLEVRRRKLRELDDAAQP